MRLQDYFALVEDSLRSRPGVEVESFTVRVQAPNAMAKSREESDFGMARSYALMKTSLFVAHR